MMQCIQPRNTRCFWLFLLYARGEILMVHPVQVGKRTRMSFSKLKEVGDMPNLIEVQLDSYQWFLKEGLEEVFDDINPIQDYTGNLNLEFIGYKLDMENTKYSVEECKERDATYAAPLKVSVRLINKETGEVYIKAGEMVDLNTSQVIQKYLLTLPREERRLNIRSVLTCRTRHGVCRKCYGRNLATGGMVDIGEAVGTIAAQSIGEPGTQLTMRTFHTGGVAGDDITQGLPRVEELFEARKPKGQGIISDTEGAVHIEENVNNRRQIVIMDGDEVKAEMIVPYGSRLKVVEGQKVEAGDELTEGSVNPHDLLTVKGVRGVQMYLLREVQRVYRLQGVDINDKHIEVMVRQMLKKVKIDEPGDTRLLPGTFVDKFEFEEANEEVIAQGLEPATCIPVLLGITKASLATDSFLSAASFQETTRVLTDAAIKGKMDPLLGLKENVIIGKLIPAGTGLSRYRDIEVNTVDSEAIPDEFSTAAEIIME